MLLCVKRESRPCRSVPFTTAGYITKVNFPFGGVQARGKRLTELFRQIEMFCGVAWYDQGVLPPALSETGV